ncbi:hypothetical protein E4T42_03249 [Aureobasidium subglaciale]|nr:hypothetical protein E4T42_03249 [Aureobasidium subglaciale]
MPRDGCKECSRRRIKCDKGAPECAKCLKKGITCTGVGRQIRFVDGVISKGKRKGHTFPGNANFSSKLGEYLASAPVLSPQPECDGSQATLVQGRDPSEHDTLDLDIEDAVEARTTLTPYREQSDVRIPSSTNGHPGLLLHLDPTADLTLELLKPGIQMLFNHFSQSIASIMVVFDDNSNGYRNFLLPLAYADDLVQRAVSVTAAFHLSTTRPDLLPIAEEGRSAIIQRLRADAFAGNSNKVFSMSTWATIILLLVGETVTGSQDFVHLYPMLTNLLSNKRLLTVGSTSEREFLLQQSRMFQLFTPPLLDLSQGRETFGKDLSFYFDFIFSQQYSATPSIAEHTIVFQEAIQQARNIYMRQAFGSYHAGQLFNDIEQLRLLVTPIKSDNPCMHTLPWVYFIAAASSNDQGHREFFARRLAQVHKKTRMNNIIVALERLKMIWLLQPNGKWARNPSLVNPVLII